MHKFGLPLVCNAAPAPSTCLTTKHSRWPMLTSAAADKIGDIVRILLHVKYGMERNILRCCCRWEWWRGS